MTKKPEKINSKDLDNHTLDVILDNNPLDMNSVSGLLEWIHEVSGHKDGCPVLFVDDGWLLSDRQFIISDLLTETLENFVKRNDISGWNITDHTIDYFQHTDVLMQEGQYASGLNIAITVERKTGYYIFKVIFPIVLILMICWSVVWIHPRELESRLTITIVCLLSLIAYNFVIDKELPKLEYLTVLDWVILISYLYAAIPNFLTIASFKFLQTNEPLSMKLESYGKRYGPTSYITIIIFIVFLNANLNSKYASTMISWMAGNP